MKTATFFEGVGFALLASIIGSVSYFALSLLLPESLIIRLLISAFTIVYLVYLFSRTRERVGRATIMLLCLMLIAALWVLSPPLSLFLMAPVFAIWLTRSLYFHSSLFSALADLGLTAFSLAAAFWACHHTGSLFLSLWCFFLVQALFVFIPSTKKPASPRPSN